MTVLFSLPSTSRAPFGPLIHKNYPLQQDTWHLHSLAQSAVSGTLLYAYDPLTTFPHPYLPSRYEVQLISHQKGEGPQVACLYSELISQSQRENRKTSKERWL